MDVADPDTFPEGNFFDASTFGAHTITTTITTTGQTNVINDDQGTVNTDFDINSQFNSVADGPAEQRYGNTKISPGEATNGLRMAYGQSRSPSSPIPHYHRNMQFGSPYLRSQLSPYVTPVQTVPYVRPVIEQPVVVQQPYYTEQEVVVTEDVEVAVPQPVIVQHLAGEKGKSGWNGWQEGKKPWAVPAHTTWP